jgi:hypothetical protein
MRIAELLKGRRRTRQPGATPPTDNAAGQSDGANFGRRKHAPEVASNEPAGTGRSFRVPRTVSPPLPE